MFTRTLRQSFKRQEGQAMVLACLLVLVLAIGVITTVNLGHAVHERLRLQNTADAAAYSMAAMEARAFNFYAFANRTQVSHYVAAMVWQSIASVLYFLEAWVTDLYGFFLTLPLTQCVKPKPPIWSILCPILENVVPYLNVVLKAIKTFMTILLNVIIKPIQAVMSGTAGSPVEPDKILGFIVQGLNYANRGMAAVSEAVAVATLTHVGTSSSDIVIENDPNADPGATKYIGGLINACIFQRTHFKETNITPVPLGNPWSNMPVGQAYNKETNKESRAKRVMGQIANATRATCDTGTCLYPSWTTRRTLSGILPGFNFLPGGLKSFIDKIVPKDGQTRMLTFNNSKGYINKGAPNNYIRQKAEPSNAPIGQLAQGDAIGSDDLYKMELAPLGFRKIGFAVGSGFNPFACFHHDPFDEHDKNDDDMEDYEQCWGDPYFREDDGPTPKNYNALKTSIWALHPSEKGYNGKNGNNGGIHWRLNPNKKPPGWKGYQKPSNGNNAYKQIALNSYGFCLVKVGGFGIGVCVLDFPWDRQFANVRPVEDGNHKWNGLARFPHFEPGQYAKDCSNPGLAADTKNAADRNTEFNQPSSWLFLNKGPDKLKNPVADPTATRNDPALLNSSGKISVSITQGSTTDLTLEDRDRAKFLFVLDGMTVMSRGQTYYHRPGNWTEQPNFFNPYWRPRLASVWQGRYSLPLLGGWKNKIGGASPSGNQSNGSLQSKATAAWAALKNLPQKIITH